MQLSKFSLAVAVAISASTGAAAQDHSKAAERIESAGTAIGEIMQAPDKGIPEEVIHSAQCIAVVPALLKGGFVFGAEYGHGVASCRTSTGWSAPAFFGLKGGSFGLQIGGQAVDLVLLIMNEHGMRDLLASKFELGADASVAAGPVGRHAEGDTDISMRAEVLTYSRARGIFAGATLKGALVIQDRRETRAFYGRAEPFRTILKGGIPAPQAAYPFLAALGKYASASHRRRAQPMESRSLAGAASSDDQASKSVAPELPSPNQTQ